MENDEEVVTDTVLVLNFRADDFGPLSASEWSIDPKMTVILKPPKEPNRPGTKNQGLARAALTTRTVSQTVSLALVPDTWAFKFTSPEEASRWVADNRERFDVVVYVK